jgi:hypothetical protein
MNFEFLIVFTSNGLVFATLLYFVMTCEMPGPKGSAKSMARAKIDGLMTMGRESISRYLAPKILDGPGTLMMVESQKPQVASLGPAVNKP